MYSRLAFCLFTYFISTTLADNYEGWHQRVGVKEAAKRFQFENQILGNSPIVGGTVAPVNAHPYLAGIVIDVIGMYGPSACGGSILTASRVLTAAHCWFDGWSQAWRFTVVVGSAFLFHGGTRIPTTAVLSHSKYDARTLANDIAVVYLPVNIIFSSTVRPLALPTGPLLNLDLTGAWAVASGYGRYSDLTNPSMNTMVRHVAVQVISLAQCRAVYGDVVTDSNICTNGAGGVGICRGDSGGPLVVIYGGQEVLVGVSSFVAQDGCELGFPSAFAKVASYIDWIGAHIM